MSEFIPWFLDEFLPPILPWITLFAIVIEIVFWVAVLFGVRWLGKKILSRHRRVR